MADRSVALTAVNGGINRLRVKGAADRNSLYDLLNGYVTQQKTIKVRPGTFRTAELPEDTAGDGLTKGLCVFNDLFHVFSDVSVDVPAGFVLHVLSHPDATADAPIPLTDIHFAQPFLGYLYVTAEFEGGDVYDYWLQTGDAWQADTVYKHGDIVTPSVPNGFAYQATRLTSPSLSWAPNVQRALGDVVEPTVYNDYLYTVVDVQGTNPRSGTVEPIWPTEDGQQVIEDADGVAPAGSVPTEPPDLAQTPNPSVPDRYDNGAG
jgi:hypothetical protein